MDLPQGAGWAAGIVGAVAGCAGGLWSYLTARAQLKRSSPADVAESTAQLAAAVSAQTRAFVEELQADRRELRLVVTRQSRSIRKLVARVEQLEAENEVCRQGARRLELEILSLEEVLRANGIQIAAREMPGSFVILEGDRTTVFKEGESKPRVTRKGD